MNIEPEQPRLIVGPLQFIHHDQACKMTNVEQWALPGGGYASLQEVTELCKVNGWKPPKRVFI